MKPEEISKLLKDNSYFVEAGGGYYHGDYKHCPRDGSPTCRELMPFVESGELKIVYGWSVGKRFVYKFVKVV